MLVLSSLGNPGWAPAVTREAPAFTGAFFILSPGLPTTYLPSCELSGRYHWRYLIVLCESASNLGIVLLIFKEAAKMNRRFVAGVVSGAVVGATLGLLAAPKSGKDTRQLVRNKAGSLVTSLKQRRSRKNSENIHNLQAAPKETLYPRR